MDKKAYLQISFAWLFAIIVGAFILFLAIYGTIKFINIERTTQDAKTGKEIGVLLNPLETSFETVKTTSLTMPVETRIYNRCNNNGVFGKQIIQISQKSFNKWTETEVDISFSNKYILSEKYIEGKKFYILSKPFDFPFKVADLIYMTSSSKKYCFVDAPSNIEDEILELNQENLLVEDCEGSGNIEICFEDSNCNVDVDYHAKYVKKNGEKMYFEGDTLMYAAIFADPEVYECQLKRLMQRTKQLALLYNNKAVFVSREGCHSDLNLLELSNSASDFSNSDNLNSISYIAEEIKERTEGGCKLW